MKVFSDILKSMTKKLLKFYPSRIIATFMGFGYLPEWQKHWVALASIPINALIVYLVCGFDVRLSVMSAPLVILAITMFFVATISIWIFQKECKDANDEIVIHHFISQTLVLAIAAPATLAIGFFIIKINSAMCAKYLYCPQWLYYTLTYVPIVMIPYAVLRLIDKLEPWPTSYLVLYHNNAISRVLQTFSNALYAILIIYLVAFMFTDLQPIQVVTFARDLFNEIFSNIDKEVVVLREFYNHRKTILDTLPHS